MQSRGKRLQPIDDILKCAKGAPLALRSVLVLESVEQQGHRVADSHAPKLVARSVVMAVDVRSQPHIVYGPVPTAEAYGCRVTKNCHGLYTVPRTAPGFLS